MGEENFRFLELSTSRRLCQGPGGAGSGYRQVLVDTRSRTSRPLAQPPRRTQLQESEVPLSHDDTSRYLHSTLAPSRLCLPDSCPPQPSRVRLTQRRILHPSQSSTVLLHHSQFSNRVSSFPLTLRRISASPSFCRRHPICYHHT